MISSSSDDREPHHDSDEAMPAQANQAAEEATPDAEEATPAAEEATPAAEESTPAADEATPAEATPPEPTVDTADAVQPTEPPQHPGDFTFVAEKHEVHIGGFNQTFFRNNSVLQ
jgi:hypothetical protein